MLRALAGTVALASPCAIWTSSDVYSISTRSRSEP